MRRKTALALIAFMTVLAVVLSVTLGGDVVPIILFPLPIAFPLLWWSASELSVNDVL